MRVRILPRAARTKNEAPVRAYKTVFSRVVKWPNTAGSYPVTRRFESGPCSQSPMTNGSLISKLTWQGRLLLVAIYSSAVLAVIGAITVARWIFS